MGNFNIPVVLIIFKRKDKTLQVLERIAQIKPLKLYLLGDEGRDKEEKRLVKECREAVERSINWECEVIKNYAEVNRGVYDNIGGGAKWVLEKEPWAIFLEDDNLPELTFFSYCEELLHKYKDEKKVLWICGTNYLGKYQTKSIESYMFTKHLLPCGWASWSDKFLKYYDGELNLFVEETISEELENSYDKKALYNQQMSSLNREVTRKRNGEKFISWDFQMAFSIRIHNLYGISPSSNQIKNIGVDEHSEHGGNSFNDIMTKRFCGMESYPLNLPLTHPEKIYINKKYENLIGNIILYPLRIRVKYFVGRILKKVIGMDKNESLVNKIMFWRKR